MTLRPLVLVTGATGYIGSRLVPELLARGWRVRAAARSLDKFKKHFWSVHPALEMVQADLFDLPTLKRACQGCENAFYLVHSMNPQQKDFSGADRGAASNMVEAAKEAGIKRLFYLGGLGEDQPDLSEHLRSRAEVAKILEAGPVPVTVLRAAMIIGAGSASFEILRYLVERLPVMVTPRWVSTESQPVAVSNVIHYLAECLERAETTGKSFDIGGPEVLTYRSLMEIYAEEAHLRKRLILPVPVLTPRLSSYWIHLVTPLQSSIARPLAEGLRNKVVVKDPMICKIIPQPLLTAREAIRIALDPNQYKRTEKGEFENTPLEWVRSGDAVWAGGSVFVDRRRAVVCASREEVWKPIAEIGGKRGWYYANWLWELRGFLDRLAGGPGMRRTSKDRPLKEGEVLDFWRIEKIEPGQCLQLAAEMKLPGKASLEFKVRSINPSESELIQTACFIPRGLSGIFYWYLVLPFHHFIFGGMLAAIVKKSVQNKKEPGSESFF